MDSQVTLTKEQAEEYEELKLKASAREVAVACAQIFFMAAGALFGFCFLIQLMIMDVNIIWIAGGYLLFRIILNWFTPLDRIRTISL